MSKITLTITGYAGDLNAIHKDKAMYLLNCLSETPLKNMSALEKSNKEITEYKELIEASRLLKNCATKSFVYGVLYGGEDTALQAAKDRYKNDKIGRLKELPALLPIEINRLFSSDISNFQGVSSVRFESIDQRSYELLQELVELDPTIVNNDVSQSIRYYNVPDALEALLHVQRSKLLEKLMQEEKEKENSEKSKEELARRNATDQWKTKENQQEKLLSRAMSIR